MTIKRYAVYPTSMIDISASTYRDEADDGEYCLFTDHAADHARLQSRIKELEFEYTSCRSDASERIAELQGENLRLHAEVNLVTEQRRLSNSGWELNVKALKAELATMRAKVIEECAQVPDRIAYMMECGAGELNPGERLRQVSRIIRALLQSSQDSPLTMSKFESVADYEAARAKDSPDNSIVEKS